MIIGFHLILFANNYYCGGSLNCFQIAVSFFALIINIISMFIIIIAIIIFITITIVGKKRPKCSKEFIFIFIVSYCFNL